VRPGEEISQTEMPEFDKNAALRRILDGTAAETGGQFFDALVSNLASVFDIDFAWVTEYIPAEKKLRALAFFQDGDVVHDFEYALSGTPCEPVIQGARLVHHPRDVQSCYPQDEDLRKLGMESYLGIPLMEDDGTILGHMAIMDREPMPKNEQGLGILQIFSTRATVELRRMQADKVIEEQEKEQKRLRRELKAALETLSESENRYRDLFEQAPIAYVHEDLESRFIRANKTALRILGLPAEKAVGFMGRSLAPDTDEARKRVVDALGTINRGEDALGKVLELSRYDNGEPVWIRWWSSPDPSGSFTRTMFIDISDLVHTKQENIKLEAQNTYLKEEIDQSAFGDIVGTSQPLARVLEEVAQVAPTEASVLILGETGTGKELIARAVFKNSSRADKPFIKVNCGALPDSLIESELYGHEKGSFTGATARRDGRFKLADGGTIFLDEIGDLPLQLQVKLLRVLQEGEFEPIGSATTHKVDVRVITATHHDLFQAVQDGEFREDLYYRLAVFPIELPPLRDRASDIPDLVQCFTRRLSKRLGRSVQNPSESDIQRLLAYGWPGNIRELQNIIERAIITSTNGQLNLVRAFPETGTNATVATDKIRTITEMEQLERANLKLALEQTNWCVSGEQGAARLLGMNPSTLNSRLKALNIKRPG